VVAFVLETAIPSSDHGCSSGNRKCASEWLHCQGWRALPCWVTRRFCRSEPEAARLRLF